MKIVGAVLYVCPYDWRNKGGLEKKKKSNEKKKHHKKNYRFCFTFQLPRPFLSINPNKPDRLMSPDLYVRPSGLRFTTKIIHVVDDDLMRWLASKHM